MICAQLVAPAASARDQASGQVLKIGTMAPENTLPHRALLKMAQIFDEETQGQVQLKIYPGTVGDEPTIVRKLRVGQLQGALLSSKGLGNVSTEPIAMQLPMMFDSTAEIDAVLAQMQPTFDRALEADGLVPLAWSDGGWIYLFASEPAVSVVDMARRKMWMWPHDDGAVASFASIGLQPVILSDVDILPALRTGMVEVFPGTPMTALALQTFPSTPHMVDVPIAFMLAAVVVDRSAWQRIPPQQRARILARCQQGGAEMSAEVRRSNVEALAILKTRGVVVHSPSPAQREAWRTAGARALELARGRSVDAALVDEVLRRRDAFRASHRSQP